MEFVDKYHYEQMDDLGDDISGDGGVLKEILRKGEGDCPPKNAKVFGNSYDIIFTQSGFYWNYCGR